MSKIKFVSHDGEETEIDADDGMSVMEAAVFNGVEGIDADCGGELSCATCHVYVQKDWLGKLDPASSDEMDLLELAYEPTDESRLSCQIKMSADLDGIVINIPETQA